MASDGWVQRNFWKASVDERQCDAGASECRECVRWEGSEFLELKEEEVPGVLDVWTVECKW
jgi:hypothetical protein